MPIGFNTPESFKGNKEDELIDYIRHEIADTNDFLFFNHYITQILRPFNILMSVEDTEPEGGYFYTFPLLSFPYCLNLEKDKIKIVREGIRLS